MKHEYFDSFPRLIMNGKWIGRFEILYDIYGEDNQTLVKYLDINTDINTAKLRRFQ